MKISDLIKSLEKIKAKHGDLPIVYDRSFGYYHCVHVTSICDEEDDRIIKDSYDVVNLDSDVKNLNISKLIW